MTSKPEQAIEVFQSLHQYMPVVDTEVKSCTVAIDYQSFSSYTACTSEWPYDAYPTVIFITYYSHHQQHL